MLEGLQRAEARVREIRSLLGERDAPNGEFERELKAASRGEESLYLTPMNAGEQHAGGVQGPEGLQPFIREASGKTGLPENLITAVIGTESGFNPIAVSRAGAMGLMQLMPGTARGLGVSDPFDERQNILGGSEYLKQQLTRFGSVEKALAAYNAGPKAVERFGGVPPYRETQEYVRKVLSQVER